MRTKIHIKEASIRNNELLLQPDEIFEGTTFIAKEQVLADSDHQAFIYLLEKNDEYTYISLPESIWRFLCIAIKENYPVFIASEETKFELSGIVEELIDLLENIKGNSNYGEAFTVKVEQVFTECR